MPRGAGLVQGGCCGVQGEGQGLAPWGSPTADCNPLAFPGPLSPMLCLSPRATHTLQVAVPHTSLFPLADTATGQRWLGEQPQAEASCPPHLPGRADPARDENQGSEQRGESQGPANAAAGEGPAGQGLPGALVMCAPAVRGWEADWAHCSCPVPQFPSEAVCVCATACLCIILGALTAWDDLGREGKRARVALLSVCPTNESSTPVDVPSPGPSPPTRAQLQQCPCSLLSSPWLQGLGGCDVFRGRRGTCSLLLLSPCSPWVLTPRSPAQSSRRRSAMPVLTTIDLTEDDSRDSSQSSSTISGSSSQEGQNGSAELAAEEPESREAGIALEYQVRGAPCSAASPLCASPSPCAGQWEGSGSLSPVSGWALLQH